MAPSLSHVICGIGLPLAAQSSVAVEPDSKTVFDGARMNSGAVVNPADAVGEMVYVHCNITMIAIPNPTSCRIIKIIDPALVCCNDIFCWSLVAWQSRLGEQKGAHKQSSSARLPLVNSWPYF